MLAKSTTCWEDKLCGWIQPVDHPDNFHVHRHGRTTVLSSLRIYTLLNIIGYAYPGSIDSFKGEWSAREQRLVDDSDGFPYSCNQLFYVSRAISEDARAAFYSVNTLHFYEMQDLLNLTPVSLISLSHSLRVYKARGGCHGTVAEIMENDAQLTANGVLEAWRSFCSMLAANKTRDDQFELRLICGAASTETAAAFLAPIHDLPRLKALSIRIGPNRNFDIQNMVMKTIRQKTTYFCPEPESFNFAPSNTPASLHPGISYSGLSTNASPRSNAGSSNALGTQSVSGTVVITTVRLPIPLSPLPTPRQSVYSPSLSSTAGIPLKCATKNGACFLMCLPPSKHHGAPKPLGSSANSLLTRGNICVMSAGRLVQQSNSAILLRSNSTF
ncbi:hypothetical protein BDV09DRAFT_190291 [Aspergillus tetrazonus]